MDKSLRDVFAEEIKQARIKLNYSQSELAEKVGLKNTDISAIENGKRNLTFSIAEKICKELCIVINFTFDKATARQLVINKLLKDWE